MSTSKKEKNQFNAEGKMEGYWEEYYSNGQIYFKGVYLNGIEHGRCKWYDRNGKLSLTGYFKNGEDHGWWKWYDREELIESIFYVNI